MKKITLAAIALASALILPVHAAELIYEGFDYGLADGTTMSGVAATGTGITGNWALGTSGTSGTRTINYTTTGLTFGNLSVAAGAVTVNVSGGSSGGKSVQMGALLDTGTVTGSVYTSYLFNTSATESVATPTMQVRLNAAQTASTNTHMLTLADGTNVNANSVAYTGSGTAAANNTLTINTTYLAISKFTNVGAGTGTGDAEMWVFTVAGFTDWQILGGGLEANLTTYAVSGSHLLVTGTTLTTANSLMDNTQYLSLAGSGFNGTMTTVIDELRWGTTLADVVTSVPEPATYGVAMGVGALFLIMARRRKAGRS